MKLAAKAASVLVSAFLLVTVVLSPLKPFPLFVFPAAGAVVLAIVGKGYRLALAATVGLMVKETQLTGFPFTLNAIAAVGAFALADWKPAAEVQLALPLVHGAVMMCRVSEACPDPSISSYAATQRIMLSVLVGLSALAMVLRAVDRVPVLWHGASLMVRALSLAIVGVHVFLEAAICQSEESEAVRAAYGLMAAAALA